MDEKPKVTVTSSEDPLDGKIIHDSNTILSPVQGDWTNIA